MNTPKVISDATAPIQTPPQPRRRPAVDYIHQLSALEILSASYSIFLRNARAVIGIYIAPLLPFLAAASYYRVEEPAEPVGLVASLVAGLALFGITLFAAAALTIAIADVCLGRPAQASRSWRLAFARGGLRLLGTLLLGVGLVAVAFFLFVGLGSIAAMWLGLNEATTALVILALLIPGIVLALQFMFAQCVVVLEGVSGMRALRRSRELSRGMLWRNFGTLFLVNVASIPIALLFGILGELLAVAISLLAGPNSVFDLWLAQFVQDVVSSISGVLGAISLVLLYYDMRARKEAFDSASLAQELLR